MSEIEQVRHRIACLEVDYADAMKLYETNPIPALKLGADDIRRSIVAHQELLEREEARLRSESACDSPLGKAVAALFRYEQYDYWDSSLMQAYVTIIENTLAENGAKIIYDTDS